MKYAWKRSAACACNAVLLLCLTAPAVLAQQPQQKEGVSGQESRRIQQALAREVRHELLLLPYYGVFDWLEFEVLPDDTVVLKGFVTAPPDTKSAAEKVVKDIEGVKQVVNKIEVLPVSPNDDRLRNALYRAVYSGPLFRYAVGSLNSIHIVVRNGRATLYGIVDSESDKNLAHLRARGVGGVFEVNNNLVVRKKDDQEAGAK